MQSETKVQMYTIGLLTHHISHEKYKWIPHRNNVSTLYKIITLSVSGHRALIAQRMIMMLVVWPNLREKPLNQILKRSQIKPQLLT